MQITHYIKLNFESLLSVVFVLTFLLNVNSRCAELTEENCHLQEELAEMQRELQSYQDEGGEKMLELKQELALVRSQLEESKERQELAERQSAKTEQVRHSFSNLTVISFFDHPKIWK